MTVAEARKILGVTRQAVVERCNRGTLRGTLIRAAAGWYWEIEEESVRALVAEEPDANGARGRRRKPKVAASK